MQVKAIRVMLAEVHGSHKALSLLPTFRARVVPYSADGQYVLIGSRPSRPRASVWHIVSRQRVLSSEGAEAVCLPVWASVGCIIFCPAFKSLIASIGLSAKGCGGEAIHQPYQGPRLLQGNQYQPPIRVLLQAGSLLQLGRPSHLNQENSTGPRFQQHDRTKNPIM